MKKPTTPGGEPGKAASRVLVAAVGGDPGLEALARVDGPIWARHFDGVAGAIRERGRDLLPLLSARRPDALHLLARIDVDGNLAGLPVSELMAGFVATGGSLLILAAANSVETLADHVPPGPLDVVMTVDRRGDLFPAFMDQLVERLAGGMSLPVAWVDLVPQTAHAPIHDRLPICVVVPGHGEARLRGRPGPTSMNAGPGPGLRAEEQSRTGLAGEPSVHGAATGEEMSVDVAFQRLRDAVDAGSMGGFVIFHGRTEFDYVQWVADEGGWLFNWPLIQPGGRQRLPATLAVLRDRGYSPRSSGGDDAAVDLARLAPKQYVVFDDGLFARTPNRIQEAVGLTRDLLSRVFGLGKTDVVPVTLEPDG